MVKEAGEGGEQTDMEQKVDNEKKNLHSLRRQEENR